ncbi:MAG TPA: DNA-directed RNA polymerase subunit delta [Bacillota bacterium]|jgi:DNA-directed RNA polymerase subunit delta
MAIAQGKELDPETSPVELAYRILLQSGQPMYYKDLIDEVVKVKTLSPAFAARGLNPTRLMAEIHTEINMDNRFQHLGKGLWGLRRWAPKQVPTKATPLITSLRPRRDDAYHRDEAGDEPHDEIDALRIEGEEDNGWDQEPEGEA